MKLFIVGEHQLFRECLASILNEHDRFSIQAQVDNLDEILDSIREFPPDILLVDLVASEEKKLTQVQTLVRTFPQVKVIVFGLPKDEAEILRCIEAGASGYVLMDSSLDELSKTIDRVLRGESVCSPEIISSLFSRLAELAHDQRSWANIADFDLTPREAETLDLIAEGLSNQQIADRLCLSLHTVKNHVHHILEKLEVEHRMAAVEQAQKRRWLSPLRRLGSAQVATASLQSLRRMNPL